MKIRAKHNHQEQWVVERTLDDAYLVLTPTKCGGGKYPSFWLLPMTTYEPVPTDQPIWENVTWRAHVLEDGTALALENDATVSVVLRGASAERYRFVKEQLWRTEQVVSLPGTTEMGVISKGASPVIALRIERRR